MDVIQKQYHFCSCDWIVIPKAVTGEVGDNVAFIKIVARWAMTGKDMTIVHATSSDTVEDFREDIAMMVRTRASSIQLLLDGRLLKGHANLRDAGLSDGVIIDIVIVPITKEWLDLRVFPTMFPMVDGYTIIASLRQQLTEPHDSDTIALLNNMSRLITRSVWPSAFERYWKTKILLKCLSDPAHSVETSHDRRRTVAFAVNAAADREMRYQELAVEASRDCRRTVAFAINAAADREARYEELVVEAPGICVGSVPREQAGGRVIDARWNESM